MAYLNESTVYPDGVYQLETTDPVLAGAAGVSNFQSIALANRTNWLKSHVDAIDAALPGKAPLSSPTFTGTPAVPTAAAGTSTTQAASCAFVQTAMGAIAWGDIGGTLADQTDLNSVLAAKAPISSPSFTGTPTAPTPGGGDNSTKLATTAFVQSTITGIGAPVWGGITGVIGNQIDLTNALALKAPLASPTFTGTPAAPTAPAGTNTDQVATTAFVASAMPAATPVGTVIFVAQSTAPTGYLKANGAAISRVTYATLFAAIGTTFGVGDGSTTFNLPDLRGEFVRGWDDARGVDGGRTFGSAQADDLKSHTHPTYSSRAYYSGGGTVWAGSYPGTTLAGYASGSTEVTAATGGAEARPRNVALLACIKY